MAIITGTNQPETLPGTKDDDTITGGPGNDTALMGAGNDIFIWNPGDGSDVVQGGTGNDIVLFNGSNANETFSIAGIAGGHAQLTRDVANIVMDMNDVERLELNPIGGIDSITVNDLTGTDLKQVAIDLSAAGTPGAGDGSFDSVTANGSAASNTITITGSAGSIDITGLPAEVTIAAAEATDALTIHGSGGNDKIDASGLQAATIGLVIDGGTGNDTIKGSQAADVVIGGDGNDVITGGRGDDTAFLGNGDDRFVWNPGDGSDIVEGQAGTDTLAFNGANVSENIDISANGGRGLFTRDVAAITMDLNDVEHIEFHALGGIDKVTVNDLTGTDVNKVLVDLAATLTGTAPDGATDTVIVNATTADDTIKIGSAGSKVVVSGLAAEVSVNHSDKTDVLQLNTLAGVDTIDASKLAAGKLELHISAGDGDDKITGSAGTDIVNGDRGSDTAKLGGGDDTFIWNPGDGNDTVDGGAGNDTLNFNGANIAEKINIFNSSGHTLFTRDVANITMDLDGVEKIAFRALGGADTIHVGDLSGTDVKQVAIDLGSGVGGGDGAADSVTADASNAANTMTLTVLDPMVANGITVTGLPYALTITNPESTDALTLNGFGGNDKIDASALSPTMMALTIDGGAGNDILFGGRGADLLLGGDGNDTVEGGQGGDVALLGDGDDRFVWNPGDGSDVVEGQAGTDTLDFNGSNASENIDLSANGSRLRLFRDVANVTTDANGIEHVEIHTLGGSDTVTVNDLTGTDVTKVLVDLAATLGGSAADGALDTVVVDATAGIDSIKVASVGSKVVVTGLAAEVSVDHADKTDILTLNALAGADTIDASKLAAGKIELHVQGGDDADTIIGSAGNDFIDGDRGNDAATMGAGNDTFIWNPGDGSDTVDGGAGSDTLQFNGANIAEKIDISANADHARFTRDVANIVMDLDGVETIAFKALGGADTITVNDLSGTDVKHVAIDLAGGIGGGDGAADQVIVNGGTGKDSFTLVEDAGAVVVQGPIASVSIANAELANDKLVINGLGGDDKIDASTLPSGSIGLTIDGGIGNDTINGSLGNDLLLGGDGNDAVAGKGGSDTALLGAGDDLYLWADGDGNATVEGQADTDTLRATGGAARDVFDVFTNGARADLEANGALLDTNEVERIELRALGGADFILVDDLSATLAVKEVAVDLAATAGGSAGDNKADIVEMGLEDGVATSITNIGAKIVVTNAATLQTVTVNHWDKSDQLILIGSNDGDIIDASSTAGAGKMALQLLGGSGADVLLGGVGDDLISGGDGNDTLNMGAGNDHFTWSNTDDNDTVDGGAGNDTATFLGGSGGELFILGALDDHAQLTYGFGASTVDLTNVERVEINPGSTGDLLVVGDLSGTDVKQVAIDLGVAGAGDGSSDSVGLEGSDKNESVSMSVAATGITISGLSAQVTITHAEAGDALTIHGENGNDTINAGALKADSPKLELDGDDGNDSLTGGLGNDTLFGDNQNDNLKGGGGDDLLFGGSDKDTLDGGAGNDTLFGGAGDDTITGGLGDDTIKISSALDGHDVVNGFDGNPTGGHDVLDLDILFDNLGVATVDRAGRVSITDHGASVDVAIDTDGNTGNGFEVTATLKTSDAITIGEDVLVGAL